MRLTILENKGERVIIGVSIAVLALLPLIVVPGLGDPFESPRAVVAALACSALLLTFFVRPTWRLGKWATICLAGMFLWYVASALASHPASSVWGVQGRFQGLVSFAVLVAACVAGSQLTGSNVLLAAKWIAGATAALSSIVVAQALTGGVPQAFYGNTAIAGAWFAVGTGTAIAAALVAPRSGAVRPLLFAAAGLGVLATGLTGARAAALAVGVALIGSLVVARGLTWRRALLLGVAAVLVLAAGVLMRGGEVSAKFSPSALLEGSALSRTEIWRGSAEMIAERPLLGVGAGRFVYEFPAYQPLAHALAEGPDVRPDQAHNLLLQYAAEGGVPAALLWGSICVLALLAAWRAARGGNGAAIIAVGALLAYLTQALFGVAAIETDVLGWLFVGMALATGGSSKQAVPPIATGALVVGTLAVACACAWYVAANSHFGRGTALFEQGDLRTSQTELNTAIDMDPLTDIYRVAGADTASYLARPAQLDALASLDRGLVLEPHSYDLALARARMLRVLGMPKDVVADAYRQALALYPLGVTVRGETVTALEAAGKSDEAKREQLILDELLVPDPGNAQ